MGAMSGSGQKRSSAKSFRIYIETLSANDINTGIARIKLGRTLLRQDRYAEAEAETRAGYDILAPQMDPR